MRFLMAFGSLVFALNSFATIYKHNTVEGVSVFSDVPSSEAVEIRLPPSNSLNENSSQILAVKNKSDAETLQNSNETQKSLVKIYSLTKNTEDYLEFSIISPTNQQVIQNQQQLHIELLIKPELKTNDKVQLVVDGKIFGVPSQIPQFVINNPERGEHKLQALLHDAEGKLIKSSNTVTIYVHQPIYANH